MDILVREKCTRRGEWVGWKGVKKLFIDRLKWKGAVVLDASRRVIGEFLEIIGS